MKMIIAAFYLVMTIIGGWFSPEIINHFNSQACSVKSIVIYNEKEAKVINTSKWFSEVDGVHHRYSAIITREQAGKITDSIRAERTIVTDADFRARYVKFTTADAFRISGPETSSVWPGAYIDPLAEKGFNASVYLFKVGDRWIQGFNQRPRALCTPEN